MRLAVRDLRVWALNNSTRPRRFHFPGPYFDGTRSIHRIRMNYFWTVRPAPWELIVLNKWVITMRFLKLDLSTANGYNELLSFSAQNAYHSSSDDNISITSNWEGSSRFDLLSWSAISCLLSYRTGLKLQRNANLPEFFLLAIRYDFIITHVSWQVSSRVFFGSTLVRGVRSWLAEDFVTDVWRTSGMYPFLFLW